MRSEVAQAVINIAFENDPSIRRRRVDLMCFALSVVGWGIAMRRLLDLPTASPDDNARLVAEVKRFSEDMTW